MARRVRAMTGRFIKLGYTNPSNRLFPIKMGQTLERCRGHRARCG